MTVIPSSTLSVKSFCLTTFKTATKLAAEFVGKACARVQGLLDTSKSQLLRVMSKPRIDERSKHSSRYGDLGDLSSLAISSTHSRTLSCRLDAPLAFRLFPILTPAAPLSRLDPASIDLFFDSLAACCLILHPYPV